MYSPRTKHARRLFADLPINYDRMAALLSFGQDPRWRRFMVSRIPRDGARVLDVATGTAAVALELVRERDAQWVLGLDQSEPMLRRGVENVRDAGVGDRVTFVLANGGRLPFADASFDALTFTYLMRYVDDPAATIAELARVVRPGGVIANLEFHVPSNPLWHAAWWGYTRLVLPVAGRFSSAAWFHVGRFLGPSISRLYERYPLQEHLRIWRGAGIEEVSSRVMSLGGGVVIWGVRAG